MIVTTSKFNMNIKTYNKLLKLFQEYRSTRHVSANEFIETKLLSTESFTLTDEEIEFLVLLINHAKFLDVVKTNFITHYNIRNYKEVRIIMVIFVIIFACREGNIEEIFELFKQISCAFKRRLLQYFCNEDNLITTALTGCKFYEDEYVLKHIINPVLSKAELLKQIDEFLYDVKYSREKKPLTIPDHLIVLQRKKAAPTVPLNTPIEYPLLFQAKEIPKTLYVVDSTEKKLMDEHEKNKLKAQKLLEQAKALTKNYCKLKEEKAVVEKTAPSFKAKKAPLVKQDVETKGNIASVLRQGNLCIKEREKEIKDIETVLKGGFTLEKYEAFQENARQLEQQKCIEDIERKHLEGLLTFEESILAKKKLIETNKERFKQFMEERDDFLRKIKEWKAKEEEKMKLLVKKGQDIERNAKESEKKLKEERRNQVSQFKDATKKLLQDAFEQKQKELAKKVKLIEEIKTLHQLKSLQVKEFDPTECPNLGLLCEMSIAELQERLASMKIRMERQLEQKRRCIKKYKERQKQMVENVKNFVVQCRMSKPKTLPIGPAKLGPSPDLDKLRKQLEYARELRKKS